MKDDQPTSLETLFDKIKIPRRWGLAQLIRDAVMIFLILIVLAIGFTLFGAVQYVVCISQKPDITLMQCFRIDGQRSKR